MEKGIFAPKIQSHQQVVDEVNGLFLCNLIRKRCQKKIMLNDFGDQIHFDCSDMFATAFYETKKIFISFPDIGPESFQSKISWVVRS